MKDYHDLLLMVRHQELFDEPILSQKIRDVFTERHTPLTLPIPFDDLIMNNLRPLWRRHLTGLGKFKMKLNLPNDLDDVIFEINQFIDIIDFQNNDS